ncbi:DUF4168 domain-containing protein [Acidithiobacillus acidisediminis]|uniref:DUF4168 domain-containing protein n=1 Tax=Acidithiobacillus TaxID=119977 RepID=UPI00200EA478|nr:DUF4168 domain-containing protein [Acidithiobacillus sp. S30A2]
MRYLTISPLRAGLLGAVLMGFGCTLAMAATPAQVHDFAQAVEQIKPLNEQVHAAISKPGVTEQQKEAMKKSYMAKVDSILASHHLTAEQYGSMLQETQKNPAFAKEVEGAMH